MVKPLARRVARIRRKNKKTPWCRFARTGLGQKGQTTVEYILVMAVIVGMVVGIMSALGQGKFFFNNLVSPIISYMRFNYKYGDHNALGWDEAEGPKRHIQISEPAGNETFRIFAPLD